MLWVIFAVLTVGAVGSVLWPLSKAPRARTCRDIGVAIYKAQIAEIERDEAQRIVTKEDAESAKAEAARRLLATVTAQETLPGASRTKARLASLAVLIFVPALTLTIYAAIGHPDLPDAPLSARLQSSPGELDLAAAIAKVEAHLAQHPDDGRGYEVLAPVYLRIGRAGDAVNAARAALRLLGESPARQTLYGEAMVVAADGAVTQEAAQAFEAAAAKDPSAAKPRFFLGLYAEQQGDKERAMEIWTKLAADAPRDSQVAQALRQRIAALGEGPDESPGGSSIKREAAQDPQQMRAIRAMVDGLAARLAQDGNDLEGWLRLVRSYTVLQETGKARTALIDAKRNLAGDPNAIARLEALARELGLEG
jgi:cytochrome c-type biogenesis protein CcmH